MNGSPTETDVRMRGFSRRVTVQQTLVWVDQQATPMPAEAVPLAHASGRVLAEEVTSQVDVPGFHRAMMDGYALQAADTLGATTYQPLALKVVGEVFPGAVDVPKVQAGQAVRIMTGSPLPAGADAVLPVERTQLEQDRVWVQAAVPPGKNIGLRGEDIAVGRCVLPRGRRLRPQDIGLLSSVGQADVLCVRKPRVRIVITGSELLPSGHRPQGHRIVDANGPMLAALVLRDGGHVIKQDLQPDDPEQILQAMQEDVDVVLVSGGSSVGLEDHAPRLLAQHGQLAIHGIAMRPSSPAGMGRLGKRLVFLIPGNPVSCLCAYDFFAGRAIRLLSGRRPDWPYRRQRMRLRRKLVSTIGRVDYARVAITHGQVEPLSVSGASVLSSTTRADGFVLIPDDCEGYPPESEVEVFLYDE